VGSVTAGTEMPQADVSTCLFLTGNFQGSRFSLEKISFGFGGT
jgi:hypothetical protein